MLKQKHLLHHHLYEALNNRAATQSVNLVCNGRPYNKHGRGTPFQYDRIDAARKAIYEIWFNLFILYTSQSQLEGAIIPKQRSFCTMNDCQRRAAFLVGGLFQILAMTMYQSLNHESAH